MKVLVLSVTAGQGHNSCAKSVMDACGKMGMECSMLDTVKFINRLAGSVTDKGYLALGKHTPNVWGNMYKSALKLSSSEIVKQMSGYHPFVFSKLEDYINEFSPNVIVCTHVFAAQMITALYKKLSPRILTIGINTDFTIHPFWEDVRLDKLLLACDLMSYSAMKRGIDIEKLLTYGIPVQPKFSIKLTKQEARKTLGIPEMPTISMLSGSMGFGKVINDVLALNELPFDFQINVVCGSNIGLFNSLNENKKNGVFKKPVNAYGYVDNVEVIMSASDIVCTKPGGLSTSECLAIGRPMVLLKPIPGIEEYNAAFLANCGVAVEISKRYPIEEAVYNLFVKPQRSNSMLIAQEIICPAQAAQRLAEFMVEQCKNR